MELPETTADVHETLLDAERYRWLRKRLESADFIYGEKPHPVLVFDMSNEDFSISADLDASIDRMRNFGL